MSEKLEDKVVGSVEEGKQKVCEDEAYTNDEARGITLISPMIGPQLQALGRSVHAYRFMCNDGNTSVTTKRFNAKLPFAL